MGAALIRTAAGAPRAPASAAIGFALIWLFLILFVLYPLTRIFYDAFSNEAGQFTLQNFQEFFGDRYYLRSLWNSLLLGAATVLTTSAIGIAVAFSSSASSFPAGISFPISRCCR